MPVSQSKFKMKTETEVSKIASNKQATKVTAKTPILGTSHEKARLWGCRDLQNIDIQQLFQDCYMQHEELGSQYPDPNFLPPFLESAE